MLRPHKTIRRKLRSASTRHEQQLWSQLRSRRFSKVKFRRQHAIGPYIVDFFCPALQLVIELDGGGHTETTQQARDETRDTFLTSHGYRVVRIWNRQVDENLEGVLTALLELVHNSPSP
ncbi:MAG: endonuclease domain-containing protein [Deltaproteobacteria bacterium]|nr:endonuclease domain-containing protein [Deltaproteobacteria bacterium]